jgi:hypothetical protein
MFAEAVPVPRGKLDGLLRFPEVIVAGVRHHPASPSSSNAYFTAASAGVEGAKTVSGDARHHHIAVSEDVTWHQ